MMSLARSALALTLTVLIAHFGLPARAQAVELRVGAATVSITPYRPVSLAGQMNTRISQAVESPVVAAALLIYPRYLDPLTGLPCPAEIMVRRLVDGSA